jgi:hypothetical protein
MTRRADGLPETEADTRFFDLRASGYTGPIRWDTGCMPEPETTGEAAETLRYMARQRGEEVDW